MIYVIAGISKTVLKYQVDNNFTGREMINVRNKNQLYNIKTDDIIVLLPGWWGRSWAKYYIKTIAENYPHIKFDYMDGPFGEEERKKLKSEKVNGRFGILDFSD